MHNKCGLAFAIYAELVLLCDAGEPTSKNPFLCCSHLPIVPRIGIRGGRRVTYTVLCVFLLAPSYCLELPAIESLPSKVHLVHLLDLLECMAVVVARRARCMPSLP